jgi:PAS domain S-box-containing protein
MNEKTVETNPEVMRSSAMPGKTTNAKPERRVDKSERELVEQVRAVQTLHEPRDRLATVFDGVDVEVYADRNVAQEALRKSEKRFRDLLESMNEGFSITDANGIRTYANRRLCDMLGYKAEEIIGYPATKAMDEQGKSVWKKEFNKRKKGESSPYQMNFLRKDGQTLPVIISPRPIFDKEGVFQGSYSAITDIRDLKQTEQALKERERELKVKTTNLEEMNAALRVVLRRMEEDRRELEDKVRLNVQQMIQPYLDRLKAEETGQRQRKHLETLEANLREILSPFTHNLLVDYPRLTPSELQIANLLRLGKSSKEIADELGISFRTVETHRRNMRTKLGIKDKKANLKSYLLSNKYT